MRHDGQLREFRDSQGRPWMVHAVVPSVRSSGGQYLPEAYRDGWLLFVGDRHKLRVAPIPADWMTCPEPLLLRLLAGAQLAERGTHARLLDDDPPIFRERGSDRT